MNTALRLTIRQGAQDVLIVEAWEPIIIGRQTGHDQKPPSHRIREQKCRVVLAGRDSSVLSREHLLIQAQEGGRIRVTNESPRHGVLLPNRVALKSRESKELSLPASLGIADWIIHVELPNAEAAPLRALEQGPPAPLTSISQRKPFAGRPAPQDSDGGEFYLRVLETSLVRLQAAGDVKTLFDQAVHCGAELLELDAVWAMALEEGKWAQKASARRGDISREKGCEPSAFVLGKVREEKRTFWMTSQTVGIGVLPSVAAAPILDSQGMVLGAIYGHRLAGSGSARVPVNRLMALSVELLASSVSARLAGMQQRLEESSGGSFDNYFPPATARRVADAPQLLNDRKQEIALLECEIRNFDVALSRLDSADAALRLQDILDPLSNCVWEHQGVLVEYHDARLRALWGAPVTTTEFAIQAAKAAMAMLERTAELGKRWLQDLGRPLELGLVLDVGAHHVGRRGSRARFKYGPWSQAWDAVEKIQQAGRTLRPALVLSPAARALLPPPFAGRRLGKVHGSGWAEPIELFEILDPNSKAFALRGSYEEALNCFERGDLDGANQRVVKILAEYPNDMPANFLQMRAIQAKLSAGAAGPGVLRLPDPGA